MTTDTDPTTVLDELLEPEVLDAPAPEGSPVTEDEARAFFQAAALTLSPWESPAPAVTSVCRAPQTLLSYADVPVHPGPGEAASLIGLIDDLGPSIEGLSRAIAGDATAITAVAAHAMTLGLPLERAERSALLQLAEDSANAEELVSRAAAGDADAASVLATIADLSGRLRDARTQLEEGYVVVNTMPQAGGYALNVGAVPGVRGISAHALRSTRALLVARKPLLAPDDDVVVFTLADLADWRSATHDPVIAMAAEDDRATMLQLSVVESAQAGAGSTGPAGASESPGRVILNLSPLDGAVVPGQPLALVLDRYPERLWESAQTQRETLPRTEKGE